MSEIVVGPKGELPWDPSKKDEVFAATGSWIHRERARNAALDWMDEHVREALVEYNPRIASLLKSLENLGYSPHLPVERQKGTMSHNEGQYIGVKSSPAVKPYHSLRIDWDPDKGPHYNVMVVGGNETFKACFRFDPPPGQDGQAWVKKMQKKWSR